MSGIDQILQQIESEAASKEQAILADAKAHSEKIVADCAKTGEIALQKIADEAAAKIEKEKANAETAVRSEHQKQLLLAKVALVEDCIAKAVDSLRSLPTEEYFALLTKKIVAAAGQISGEVHFSKHDLERLPSDFESELAKKLPSGVIVTVSKEAADIEDGFILVHGDIEENGTFAALCDAERDRMKDAVAAVLFA